MRKALSEMSKTSQRIELVLICMMVILAWFPSYIAAQEIGVDGGGPQPPPVDISLTVENTTIAENDEVVLYLKVMPLEDMHLDISCVLPEGAVPVKGHGIMVQPYIGRIAYNFDDPFTDTLKQRNSVTVFVGPVVGGQMKEFAIRVVMAETGAHEFIAIVKALAKWGVKEEKFVVNIN